MARPVEREDRRTAAAQRAGVLASITVEDRDMILAMAILMNLAEDLARLHKEGHWKGDPNEMLLAGRVLHPVHQQGNRFEQSRNSIWLLKELQSAGIRRLYDVIRAATQGRVPVGRGMVVRWARHMSRNGRGCGKGAVKKTGHAFASAATAGITDPAQRVPTHGKEAA